MSQGGTMEARKSERARTMTEKGKELELSTVVNTLKYALKMDDLEAMTLQLKRLEDLGETPVAVDQWKDRVARRIEDIKMAKDGKCEMDQSKKHTRSTTSHKTHTKSDKSTEKSSSKKSSDEIRADIVKSKIRIQGLKKQRELALAAVETQFMLEEVKLETAIKCSDIDLQVNEDQFLGSEDEEEEHRTSKTDVCHEPEQTYASKMKTNIQTNPDRKESTWQPCHDSQARSHQVFKLNLANESNDQRKESTWQPCHDRQVDSQAFNLNMVGGSNDQLMSKLMAKATDNILPTSEFSNKFSGSAKDRHTFTQFLLRFESAYGNKISLNKSDKLLKLVECTSGDAQAIVNRCIMLGDNGYEKAWEKLKTRYGDPREAVFSIMRHLVSGAAIKIHENAQLVKFCDELVSAIEVLEHLSSNGRDYLLVAESGDNISKILRRIPPSWRNEIINHSANPALCDIQRTLERKTRNLTSHTALTCSRDAADSYAQGGIKAPTGTKPCRVCATKIEITCKFCDSDGHTLVECKTFDTKIRSNERRVFLKKQNLCFNCYGVHLAIECPKPSSCDVENCKWKNKHSPRLHNFRSKSVNQTAATDVVDSSVVESETEVVTESEPETEIIASTRVRGDHRPFFPVVPLLITASNGRSVSTFGCMDTMSSVHCADEKLLAHLELDLPTTKTIFSTVTGKKDLETRSTSLKIRGLHEHGTRAQLLKSVEFIPGNHLSQTPIPSPEQVNQYRHLRELANVYKPLELNQVSLLIGAGSNGFFVAEELRIGEDPNEPVGVKTTLGWTVFGGSEPSKTVPQVNHIQTIPADLSDDLSALWRTESNEVFSPRSGHSVEDRNALDILESTVKHLDDGHFEISLLWRNPDTIFPDNLAVAKRMLLYKRPKFLKDPTYLRMYQEQVDMYLNNGYARVVPENQPKPDTGKVWYVVHHSVQHPRKPDKLRLVFNCSHEFDGVSLNKKLYSGPDYINLLVGVLVRFRTGSCAISADIESMYLNVRVPENQTSFLRWLWFEKGQPGGKLIEMEMLVHLFGCMSSSACANFALRQCASQSPEQSQVSNEILRNFYVDDYLSSFDNFETGRATVRQVFDALLAGGFKLTKFYASDPRLLEDIPREHVVGGSAENNTPEVKSVNVKQQNVSEAQVALGVKWDHNRDILIFQAVSMNLTCSKRGVLSAIARVVYDPCGLISSVIILPARVLFQELCRRNATWDEPLTLDEERVFRKWYTALSDLGTIEIKRCVRPEDFKDVKRRELHLFADASEKCYGACCYMRELDANNKVNCALIFAKSRLAPLRRTLTLVRMELQGAATAVMIKNLLSPEMDMSIDAIHYYVDSSPVYGYIQNVNRRYQVWTSNRLAMMQASTELSQWHWIPSEMNISDIITRGITEADVFDSNHQWFRGPVFLWQPDLKFPDPPIGAKIVSDNDPELRKKQQVSSTDTIASNREKSFTETFLAKFRSSAKAKFAIAVLHKFIDRLLRRPVEYKVTTCDLRKAETVLIRIAQSESFPEELKRLHQNPLGSLPKTSPLYKLAPFIDRKGLIRVGGRISKLPGSDDFKHPIVLPKRHHVTQSLIREYHVATGHGSVKMIINELRLKFYLVGGKSSVYGLWKSCLKCQRQLAQPTPPYMHDLPGKRLQPFEPAFTNSAVDIFGHYFIRRGRSDVKRWVALFICENTKAVHLEMLDYLSMDSFMNALRRMVGRRGKVKRLTSDQGSNLKATDKEIRSEIQKWNEIEHRLLQRQIEWKFTPPTGSHMNGLAERAIRSARQVLVQLLSDQTLTDESLRTLLVECEGIMNHRPISEMSSNPTDTRALTPAHLIQPQADEIELPPGLFDSSDCNTKKRWRQVQHLTNVFWKRMLKEYYQLLQKRQKWLRRTENLKVGDLVIIVDANIHRNDWRYGRVIEVKSSDDNVVRSCILQTSSGKLERPVTKLCLMEAANI